MRRALLSVSGTLQQALVWRSSYRRSVIPISSLAIVKSISLVIVSHFSILRKTTQASAAFRRNLLAALASPKQNQPPSLKLPKRNVYNHSGSAQPVLVIYLLYWRVFGVRAWLHQPWLQRKCCDAKYQGRFKKGTHFVAKFGETFLVLDLIPEISALKKRIE